MEVNDYSQRLAQARADYWDSSKTQRENYDRDLNNLEQTHEYKEKKQADTFSNEKLKLEAENESRSSFFADKTKREIASRQREFTDSIRSSEAKNNRKNHELRDQFRGRLNRISSSFDNSIKQSNIQHADDIRDTKNNFNSKYQSAKNGFQGELTNIKDTADERFYDYQKNQIAEQKRLDDSHNNKVVELNRDSSRKLSESKAKNDQAIESAQRAHANEFNQLATSKEITVNQLRENHKASNTRSTESFEKIAGDMEKRFVNDNTRMSRENVQALRQQEEKFNHDMAGVRAIASKNIQSNSQRMNQTNLENERIAEDYEGRLERVKGDMDDHRYKQTRQLNKANSDFIENLRLQKQEGTAQLDSINRKHETYDASTRARFRKDRSAAEARYMHAMRTSENQFTEKLNHQEKGFKGVIEDNIQRHQFETGIMNENHDLALKDLNSNLQKEKTSFIEKTRREIHDDKFEMKENLTRNFEIKNDSLSQQLEQKDDELERTVASYENKLAEIKKKASSEFERYQLSEANKQVENKRTLKRTLTTKDQENNKLMVGMKRRFDKELSKVKFSHEIQTKKLIEDYEKQLRLEKKNSAKDLDIKLSMVQGEYDNLKKGSELRMDTIKNQYETKIDKMKMSAQEAELNRGNRSTT